MADNIQTIPGSGADPFVATTEKTGARHVQLFQIDKGDGTNVVKVTDVDPIPVLVTDSSNNVIRPGDNANSAIRVNIVAGGGTGGTALADKGSFVEGTTPATPISGVFNDVIGADPTEDQAAAIRITAKRGLHANLRNNAGTEVGTVGSPLRVDPTGVTTQPVSVAGVVDVTGSVVAATQSGAWSVGITGSLPAGINNIGDVDVLSLPALPTGSNVIGAVTQSGAWSVSISGTVAATQSGAWNVGITGALPAGTNNIGDVDVLSLPSLPTGANVIGAVTQSGAWSVSISGTVSAVQSGAWNVGITGSLPAGTNNIGDVDVLTLPPIPAGTNNIGDVDVLTLPAIPAGSNLIGSINPEPKTAGGLLINRLISAASTNATSIKASAGQVYTVYAHNTNAAVRYLKLYNKASAPTVGTDVPVMTLPIPGNTAGTGFVLDTGGMGIAFATGIAMALTTGVADADTGAVAANEIVINLLYK